MSEPGRHPGATRRSTWGPIAWAEGFLVAALALGTFAVASSFESCDVLGGCGPDESSLDADSVFWLVLAGTSVVAEVVVSALRSGWPREQTTRRAVLAIGGAAAALLVAAALSKALVDEYSPGFVLAVGVAGALAIRPPVSGAKWARWLALCLLWLLALVLANETFAIAGLLLIVLPVLGLADKVSTSAVEREPERTSGTT